jgi:hypothetical protein
MGAGAMLIFTIMRDPLPYDMFDVEKSAEEARRFSRMESIYHRGQDLVWNGKTVLDELCKKHGGPQLKPEHREAARRVLGSIMWGELAAWKIAAQLADDSSRSKRAWLRPAKLTTRLAISTSCTTTWCVRR